MDDVPTTQGLSEEGLALLKVKSVPLGEEQHGHMAIEIAKHLGIFWNEQGAWAIEGEHTPANATEDDVITHLRVVKSPPSRRCNRDGGCKGILDPGMLVRWPEANSVWC